MIGNKKEKVRVKESHKIEDGDNGKGNDKSLIKNLVGMDDGRWRCRYF